ncbi:glycosyltransferase [Acinetobacter soli]|uniref:glycosyltransferase family 2 protein n=1 Tax=Acinetobacter soli TaxID=487316 RepID=UPI0032B53649
MKIPKVSVLMTVFNGGPYLYDSIKSILDQDFSDFEFVIINDGSTDGSLDLIKKINDHRIKLYSIENGGLVKALNFGISKCQGDYIARMDSDDISHKSRIRLQKDFLDNNPDYSIVCSNVKIIDDFGKIVSTQVQNWTDGDQLLRGLLLETPFKPIIHPSVMLRKEVYHNLNGYREILYAEDRDFWLRSVKDYKLFRIQDFLLNYRIHSKGISRDKVFIQMTSSIMAIINYKVKILYGKDIFNNYPHIYKKLHEKIFVEVCKDIKKTFESYNEVKKYYFEKRFLNILFVYVCFFILNFEILNGDSVRKRIINIIDNNIGEIKDI